MFVGKAANKKNKVFKPLRDTQYFEKVAILERGYVIGWPGNIDYAADNLWQRAREQEQRK